MRRLTIRFVRTAAMAALRRKKQSEAELERLSGTQLQLEMQINTLESANLNAETMAAIRKASNALTEIHSGLCVLPPPLKSFYFLPGMSSDHVSVL